MIERWGDYVQPEPVWKGIPGFFDFQDVYTDIANLAQDGYTLVEVGCLLGKSACFLGEALQAQGKKVTLICVDEWPASYTWGADGTGTLEAPFETFYANVRQSGLLKTIVPIRAKSVWAASFVKDGLDFVFIDAGHEYEDVRDDIAAWLPKIRSGGMIAGHDYSATFPGVVKAVDMVFKGRVLTQGQCWRVRL